MQTQLRACGEAMPPPRAAGGILGPAVRGSAGVDTAPPGSQLPLFVHPLSVPSAVLVQEGGARNRTKSLGRGAHTPQAGCSVGFLL